MAQLALGCNSVSAYCFRFDRRLEKDGTGANNGNVGNSPGEFTDYMRPVAGSVRLQIGLHTNASFCLHEAAGRTGLSQARFKRRATAVPNSFETKGNEAASFHPIQFDTAVARRLKRASFRHD